VSEQMKIGILTSSMSDNCGSLLQTFATQRVIESRFGASVEIVDLRHYKARKLYSLISRAVVRHPFSWLLNLSNMINQKRDYEDFRKNYLHLTCKRYLSEKQLYAESFDYDVVVCGSDQVWNVEMYDFDRAYLLGWVKKARKVSFATSLGWMNTAKHEEVFQRYVRGFEKISVREESSRDYLERVLKREVTLCCDPTLLVDKGTWDEMGGTRLSALARGDYIFYYSYSYGDDEANLMVKNIAEKTNLPVYVINASRWTGRKPSHYGFVLHESGRPANLFASYETRENVARSIVSRHRVLVYIQEKFLAHRH